MTNELHARAVEAARYAAASAIRDWIHEQPFSICASSNMDTCPDWPMAFEIRDVALGAALPHLEAAEQGDPLVRVGEVVEERDRLRSLIVAAVNHAKTTMVYGGCNVPGYVPSVDVKFIGDVWSDLVRAADAIQRRFAPGPEEPS